MIQNRTSFTEITLMAVIEEHRKKLLESLTQNDLSESEKALEICIRLADWELKESKNKQKSLIEGMEQKFFSLKEAHQYFFIGKLYNIAFAEKDEKWDINVCSMVTELWDKATDKDKFMFQVIKEGMWLVWQRQERDHPIISKQKKAIALAWLRCSIWQTDKSPDLCLEDWDCAMDLLSNCSGNEVKTLFKDGKRLWPLAFLFEKRQLKDLHRLFDLQALLTWQEYIHKCDDHELTNYNSLALENSLHFDAYKAMSSIIKKELQLVPETIWNQIKDIKITGQLIVDHRLDEIIAGLDNAFEKAFIVLKQPNLESKSDPRLIEKIKGWIDKYSTDADKQSNIESLREIFDIPIKKPSIRSNDNEDKRIGTAPPEEAFKRTEPENTFQRLLDITGLSEDVDAREVLRCIFEGRDISSIIFNNYLKACGAFCHVARALVLSESETKELVKPNIGNLFFEQMRECPDVLEYNNNEVKSSLPAFELWFSLSGSSKGLGEAAIEFIKLAIIHKPYLVEQDGWWVALINSLPEYRADDSLDRTLCQIKTYIDQLNKSVYQKTLDKALKKTLNNSQGYI
ncbi:hypothetical protein [Methylovulum psychrotolerans]|nr:hypothetical protein [Methylovulum psychrotolerans]